MFPKDSQQDQEHADRRGDGKEHQAVLGGLPLGILAEHLGVIAQRELDLLEAAVDFGHDGAEVASRHVGADVDAPRGVFAIDHALRRPDAHVGHIAQAHVPAVGRVDRQIANAVEAAARCGRAPDVHIVRLAISEKVADFFACQQGRRRPAHIAGLEAIALRRGQIDLDLHLRHLGLELHVQIGDAGDALQGLLHLVRLVVDALQVGPIDAHDKGFAGSGQHLVDSFVEIGFHIVEEPRIAVDHLLDGGHRLVVVGLGIDADPVLAEIDAVDLIGQQGLPDVGAEVAHPRNGPQLAADLGHDPPLFDARRCRAW